ncbi:MAG: F0F1 ATP synthase subunit B [Bacteroidales bacterium]|jgi:F-type H+-transporting ATPase subunit b|nr:F0F1 ATP synthase subunit B [Bacteroidales bacterium]
MDLVTPGIGLIFWTTIIFLILLLILGKAAWKPINKMVNKRNQSIEDALNMAETARQEMKELQANNEKIMAEARMERDNLIKEAREIKDQIVSQAKEEAIKEVNKIKKAAELEIENQKASVLEDIRNQVLDLSVAVAEKVLRQELKNRKEQEELVNNLLKEIKFN